MMGRTFSSSFVRDCSKKVTIKAVWYSYTTETAIMPSLHVYLLWEGEHDTNFLQITCKKCQNLELFMTGPGVQFCFKWLKIRFDVLQDCDT